MSELAIPALVLGPAGCAALAATPLVAELAARRGWLLGVRDAESARKPELRRVPRVGGLAVALAAALGVAVWSLVVGAEPWRGPIGLSSFLRPAAEHGDLRPAVATVLAVAIAFATGFVDDWRASGLAARQKLYGQALAGLAFALPWLAAGEARSIALGIALAFLAVCAQNALNAFDHADGMAAGTGALGLLAPSPFVAASLLGFLCWNVGSSRRRRGPVAYLGDAGSHALGILLLALPAAWPALFVPALDLARVAWVRWRRGLSPLRGDRRHWAHRQQGAGTDGWSLALLCLAVELPVVVGWQWMLFGSDRLAGAGRVSPFDWTALDWSAPALGAALTLALYVLTLRRTPPCD
jgi:UDP-N-acetylmuramyl pentapeptide phosphotransferase/UDP-N-acetylglucosamine-1-phosphate transferase